MYCAFRMFVSFLFVFWVILRFFVSTAMLSSVVARGDMSACSPVKLQYYDVVSDYISRES